MVHADLSMRMKHYISIHICSWLAVQIKVGVVFGRGNKKVATLEKLGRKAVR